MNPILGDIFFGDTLSDSGYQCRPIVNRFVCLWKLVYWCHSGSRDLLENRYSTPSFVFRRDFKELNVFFRQCKLYNY